MELETSPAPFSNQTFVVQRTTRSTEAECPTDLPSCPHDVNLFVQWSVCMSSPLYSFFPEVIGIKSTLVKSLNAVFYCFLICCSLVLTFISVITFPVVHCLNPKSQEQLKEQCEVWQTRWINGFSKWLNVSDGVKNRICVHVRTGKVMNHNEVWQFWCSKNYLRKLMLENKICQWLI